MSDDQPRLSRLKASLGQVMIMMTMMITMTIMIESDITQPSGLEPLKADLDELKLEVIIFSTTMMIMMMVISITVMIMISNSISTIMMISASAHSW